MPSMMVSWEGQEPPRSAAVSVEVVVRIRPRFGLELKVESFRLLEGHGVACSFDAAFPFSQIAWVLIGHRCYTQAPGVLHIDPDGRSLRCADQIYMFDAVIGEAVGQEKLHETFCRPLVDTFLRGRVALYTFSHIFRSFLPWCFALRGRPVLSLS